MIDENFELGDVAMACLGGTQNITIGKSYTVKGVGTSNTGYPTISIINDSGELGSYSMCSFLTLPTAHKHRLDTVDVMEYKFDIGDMIVPRVDVPNNLTRGKSYRVLSVATSFQPTVTVEIIVIDDRGVESDFPPDMFVPLSVARNVSLSGLLG